MRESNAFICESFALIPESFFTYKNELNGFRSFCFYLTDLVNQWVYNYML